MYTKRSERRIRNNRLRRKKELRRNISLFIMTMVLIIVSSSVLFSFKTKAQEKNEVIFYKYYKSITVSDGETLWGYAVQYADPSHYCDYQEYIDEVLCMNGMFDEQITVGQHILLPYFSEKFVS